MAYDQVTFEKHGRAGIITLNRPERLNAWTPRMMVEMRAAIDECVADPMIAAAVITGAGRAFCAGADVGDVFAKQADERDSGGDGNSAGRESGSSDWVTYLRTLPKPTIAAVNGTAVGIGVTQILPMDIRIASENAKFGMFFVKMGLVPELASSALLPQMVGTARAIEWCLTARLVPAAEAKEAGLVADVTAPEKLIDRALEMTEMIARNPAPALASTRKLIVSNVHNDNVGDVMRSEGEALAAAYRTWEHKEAIAAFLGKRDPDFTKKPSGA
jgi:enoyl-CoA hydratase/carnithine racemase